MDVRCERCKTEYEFDDAKVTDAGVTVKCTSCGNIFKVQRSVPGLQGGTPTPSPVMPHAPEAREYRLRRGAGESLRFKELTSLQKWIVERKVARDDEISITGETWKKLGDIPELGPFFQIVEQAEKAAQLEPPYGAAGTETPPAMPIPRSLFGTEASAPRPQTPRVAVVNFPPPPPAPKPARTEPLPPPLQNGSVPTPFSAGMPTPAFTPGYPEPSFDAPAPSDPPDAAEAPKGSVTPDTLAPARENLNPQLPPPPVLRSTRGRRGRAAYALPGALLALVAGGALAYFKIFLPQERARSEEARAPEPRPQVAAAPVPVPGADAGGVASLETKPAEPEPAPEASSASAPVVAQRDGSDPEAPHAPSAPKREAPAEVASSAAPPPASDVAAAEPKEARPEAAAEPSRAVDAGLAEAEPADAGAREAQAAPPTPPKPAARPHDFAYYQALGDRQRGRDHAQQALDAYAKAAALAPNRVEPVAGSGLALLDLGKREQAVTTFQRALELNPQYGIALMGLAEAYRSLGLKEDAIKFYERYLELLPDGSEATIAKAAIEKLKE